GQSRTWPPRLATRRAPPDSETGAEAREHHRMLATLLAAVEAGAHVGVEPEQRRARAEGQRGPGLVVLHPRDRVRQRSGDRLRTAERLRRLVLELAVHRQPRI